MEAEIFEGLLAFKVGKRSEDEVAKCGITGADPDKSFDGGVTDTPEWVKKDFSKEIDGLTALAGNESVSGGATGAPIGIAACAFVKIDGGFRATKATESLAGGFANGLERIGKDFLKPGGPAFVFGAPKPVDGENSEGTLVFEEDEIAEQISKFLSVGQVVEGVATDLFVRMVEVSQCPVVHEDSGDLSDQRLPLRWRFIRAATELATEFRFRISRGTQ